MSDKQRWKIYSEIIKNKVIEIFNKNNEKHITKEELEDEDALNDFIHAICNIVPSEIINDIIKDDKNILEINHIANYLCVDHMIK